MRSHVRMRHGMVLIAFGLIGCIEGSKRSGGPITGSDEFFSTDTAGLALVTPTRTLDLKNGDTLKLSAGPVKKTIGGKTIRMLAYGGSIPGPTIRVAQGSEITILLKNEIGIPTMLHSHGVRLDAKYDGTMDNQKLIPDKGSFAYTLRFPDAGLFWYHPHYREDYAKEMGLYGNFLVTPSDTSYWTRVNREQVLMLDDFMLNSDSAGAIFKTGDVDRTMMGRFGNHMLVNGDSLLEMTVRKNEVVRFFATNASNTRVWNVGMVSPSGARPNFKLVASDNGQYEYFDTVQTVFAAPSERRIFEFRFPETGTYQFTHFILKSQYNNDSTIVLGRIKVTEDSVDQDFGDLYRTVDSSPWAKASIDSIRALVDPALTPDKEIMLTGTMGMAKTSAAANDGPVSIERKGIEWKDHMADMNAISDLENMHWYIIDMETNLKNHDIKWTFKRGQKVRIRIRNSTTATHPMPHPIHFHGQRFVVSGVNGRRNLNMAWKDSYLVGMGEVTDIILDASNPGTWMAQCHISEHFESMMMFNFIVE